MKAPVGPPRPWSLSGAGCDIGTIVISRPCPDRAFEAYRVPVEWF
jgi:hypothetical protein